MLQTLRSVMRSVRCDSTLKHVQSHVARHHATESHHIHRNEVACDVRATSLSFQVRIQHKDCYCHFMPLDVVNQNILNFLKNLIETYFAIIKKAESLNRFKLIKLIKFQILVKKNHIISKALRQWRAWIRKWTKRQSNGQVHIHVVKALLLFVCYFLFLGGFLTLRCVACARLWMWVLEKKLQGAFKLLRVCLHPHAHRMVSWCAQLCYSWALALYTANSVLFGTHTSNATTWV